jgi:hypothetical protein
MECANHEYQQLGFTDVASTDLLGQCAEENHGTSSIHSHTFLSSRAHGCLIEFARELVRTSDSPALELVSFCSVIPLEIPEDHSAGLFHDSAEEEAFHHQCMFNAHWNGSATE